MLFRSLLNQAAAVKDYQDHLEKFILKLNYKSFTQIVILGSASFVPFMQLSASDRRAIIEDLLDIQIFSTMNTVLKDILNGLSKDDMDTKVLQFRTDLDTQHYLNVARNTSVKNISEYEDGLTNQLNEFKKGTPAHVKAAITYNKLLHHFKIANKYQRISDGEKVKYVYLRDNPLNLETVAVRGDNDPKQIVEIAETYIDYDALFENELKTKLDDFYQALKWGLLPTEVNQNAAAFFSF